jgi:hypothetical protein
MADHRRPSPGIRRRLAHRGGDVGETFGDSEKALRLLRQRYIKVIWTPGNHELWTHQQDPVQLRGEARYQALVQMCQDHDIITAPVRYAYYRDTFFVVVPGASRSGRKAERAGRSLWDQLGPARPQNRPRA